MDGCENQKPPSGDDGCGTELANWFKMLRKAEIAAPRVATPGAKPVAKKQLALGDLPKECMTVLTAGGGMPTIAPDGTVPAALKAEAGKDAGPPAPHLDAAALEALKAEMSPKSKLHGATPAAASGARQPTPRPDPRSSVPLPDRKPQ